MFNQSITIKINQIKLNVIQVTYMWNIFAIFALFHNLQIRDRKRKYNLPSLDPY